MNVRRRTATATAVLVLAASLGSQGYLRGEGPDDDRTILHVLNRVGFGPRPGQIEALRRTGIAAYIDAQLHPERIVDDGMDERLEAFTTLNMSAADLAQAYARPLLEARRAKRQNMQGDATPAVDPAIQRESNLPMQELTQQKILRAVFSERQLQEVLTDFWFNHFNVDARKGLDRFFLTAYERDVIRPHVFGRFRDLLGATAKSPAMLFYLDNWLSADPGAADRSVSGRRAGRIGGSPRPGSVAPARGLNENYGRELLELHTLGVDGGYTQQDVTEVARAFTGWTLDRPRQGGGGFRFEPRIHDEGHKTVLGHRIDAGGMRDGEQVLDLLARHPSTARFIATKLVRRFVSDAPSATLVDRVAARFTATDGDLREVVRTILTSPEFLAAEAFRAKTKTPFEFLISALRAIGADAPNATLVARQLRELGMPPYQCQPPTGYRDAADAWTNSGALVARMNAAQTLTPPAPGAPVPAIDERLIGPLSDATRTTVARASTDAQRVALTLGSPEFQKK